MVEIGISLVIVLLLVGVGLAAWRAVRGPARRRSGTVGRVAALSLVSLLLVFLSSWRLSKSRTFQFFGGIVPRVEISTPVIALTLDDGPTPLFTEEVLAVLREEGVGATFFVSGRGPSSCST